MDQNDSLDHLISSNPYERFMIIIMNRLSSLEDKFQNLNNKMSLILDTMQGNANNVFYVLKMTVSNPIATIDNIFEYISKELDCTLCYFSDTSTLIEIQAVFYHNDAYSKFSKAFDLLKKDLSVTICHMSIANDVEFTDTKPGFMIYKNKENNIIKRRLFA